MSVLLKNLQKCFIPPKEMRRIPKAGPIVFTYVLIVVWETYMTLSKHTSRSGLFESLKMLYCAGGWVG